MAWQDRIRNEACELCPLFEEAEHVCLMGHGPRKAKVMIVGEAPGEREDAAHKAFVGQSGQLLRQTLKEAGLDPDDCYITNVAKCRPPDNRTPTKAELRTCADNYLARELRVVDPDFILAVGNSPLQALTGRSGITKYRGQSFGSDPVVFASFHPAYVLRSPQFKPTFRSDLERFASLVRGESSKAAPSRVRIVRTKSGLESLRDLLLASPVIAFDFETNDKGPKVPKKDRYYNPWDPDGAIVCVSFSVEEGQSYVVPLWHDESPWRSQWRKVLRYFKPALERPGVKLVAHNGKFDCKWAYASGVYPQLTFDTMLAAHMLEENRLKGLKPLSQLYLGADAYEIELVDTHAIPLKKLARYAGKDTDYTLRLYWILREEFRNQPRLTRVFSKLMMPASNALTKVELGGMWVDPTRLAEQKAQVSNAKEAARKKLLKYVPKEKRDTINFNSTQQLAQWLFGDLGLSIIEKTKTGAPSTNESVLLRLARKHKAPAILLDYRHWKGNLEKLEAWDQARDSKSRIHTNYKLYGTVTGRLSSERPNLQQVPREGTMRTCFGAPPGWRFIEADYSQVELRIAAMLAHDTTLLRIFATGGDPHLTTASQVTGLTPAQVLESDATGKTEHRKKAKAVNFGFLYRMGAKKFVEYARDNYGVDVTQEEAERVRKRFYALYSRLLPWHDRQVRLARKYGWVHSPIGRIRHLPTVQSSDDSLRADAERQAINSPVQSFASDLMLMSLVRLESEFLATRTRVVGTVHDAILFEAREDYAEEAAARIKEVMEDMAYIEKVFGAEVTVPIAVDIKIKQYWGER